MKSLFISLYSISLSMWVGGMFMFTAIVTPIIFKYHTRDAAGSIVGFLFPAYFPFNLVVSGVCLTTYGLLLSGPIKRIHMVVLALLVSALLINIVSYFVIHPKVRAVKAKIHSFDQLEADNPVQQSLRRSFGKLHGISALLNLIVLAEGIVLVILCFAIKDI